MQIDSESNIENGTRQLKNWSTKRKTTLVKEISIIQQNYMQISMKKMEINMVYE